MAAKSDFMLAEINSIKIAAVGDIFPGDHYFSLGHGLMSRTEQGTLQNLFADIATTLKDTDIVICNLEGPLSVNSTQTSKVQSAAFHGVPAYAQLLKHAGFTHINIANNHILQHGARAFEDTVHILEEHRLGIIGLSGKKEGCISLPVTSLIRGRTICVVGYSCVKERYLPGNISYAYFEDPNPIAEEIASLSHEFDDVIVSCHAGDEGLPYPSPKQVRMYRQFIDAGARCVLGHHSHVFQPVERYGSGIIAYSLGNFVFDLFWDARNTNSAILFLKSHIDSIDWELLPTEFTLDYHVQKTTAEQATIFMDHLKDNISQMHSFNESQYQTILDSHEVHSQRDKYIYFLRNIFRGNTSLKLQFLLEKCLPKS